MQGTAVMGSFQRMPAFLSRNVMLVGKLALVESCPSNGGADRQTFKLAVVCEHNGSFPQTVILNPESDKGRLRYP